MKSGVVQNIFKMQYLLIVNYVKKTVLINILMVKAIFYLVRLAVHV